MVVQEVLQRRGEPWEMRIAVTGHLKLTMTNWPTTEEVIKELNIDHSTVIQQLKQNGKVKKLDKWVLHELIEKKIVIVKCCLLLFYTTTMNHFLIRLCCSMKTEFYVTTRDDQLSGWPKRKLQSISERQNCTKKKKKDHGHCLLICCPSDPLQLSESRWNHYIWEVCSSTSMRCTENCNACRLHCSTERAQFSIILADHTLHNQMLKKLNELGYNVLPHPPYSPDLTPTNYHFFKHLDNFLQRKCFHNQQETENAFQEFIESQSMDFIQQE